MNFSNNIKQFNKEFTFKFLQNYIDTRNPYRDQFFKDNFPKNGIVVEIGVDRGRNSLRIFDLLKPSNLYLIDAWDYRLVQTGYDTKNDILIASQMFKITQEHVISLWKDNESVSIINKESTEAASNFNDLFFDLIYIDANHSYESAIKDLIAWHPKLKNNGIIAGHDWNHAGVEIAVREFIKMIGIEVELRIATGNMYGDDGASDWAIIRSTI